MVRYSNWMTNEIAISKLNGFSAGDAMGNEISSLLEV